VIYTILFRAVKETLITLAKDEKRLGANIGFTGILHTWTQVLDFHPHLHVVIPSGGLSGDREKWVAGKKDFLFPIPVMRKLFRGKFMDYFKEAVKNGAITFPGQIAMYEQPHIYNKLIESLYNIDWVVYVKAPFADAKHVVNYLGNYTHRIAISNSRIKEISNGKIVFAYKDRKNKVKKVMELDGVEFIRRFMMHVLDCGFIRIRHFGFLSNRNRKVMLPVCFKLLGKVEFKSEKEPWYEVIEKLCGKDPRICTKCQKGRMMITAILEPIDGKVFTEGSSD